MLIFHIILYVSTIYSPIHNSSLSGSGSETDSITDSYSNTQNKYDKNCSIACAVIVYILLSMLICFIGIFVGLAFCFITKECIIPMFNECFSFVYSCCSIFKIRKKIKPLNTECPICLEPLKSRHIYTLHCKHGYHNECIKNYNIHFNTCAICRTPM